jgi:hypothetical protein
MDFNDKPQTQHVVVLWYKKLQDTAIHWNVSCSCVNDKEIPGRVPWNDPWFISCQSIAKWIISTKCWLKCLKFSLHFISSWEFCGQCDTKAVYFTLCCMSLAHINMWIIFFFIRSITKLSLRWWKMCIAERSTCGAKQHGNSRMMSGAWRWVSPTYTSGWSEWKLSARPVLLG